MPKWKQRASGIKDPDLLDLCTASPTLSQEGLAVTLQLISSMKLQMKLEDVEGAFLKGDSLEREKGRVLVKLPSTGIPDLSDDCIIDAPKKWFDTLTKALVNFGCQVSELDPCVL